MAKFDYEINKALKETKLTRETVRAAMSDNSGINQSNILGNFMKALSRHVHGEAMRDALKALQPPKDVVQASVASSGDSRIDRALKDSDLDLAEAKKVVAATFGYGINPTPYEKNKAFYFTACLRRYMNGETCQQLVDSWAMVETPLVKTAARKCKCKTPCKNCNCGCNELMHPDEATGGKYIPDSNGIAVIAWVHQNCKFAKN